MDRVEFTRNITLLLRNMIDRDEPVILDWVKRSDQDQARMHAEGLSKCDGKTKVSAHQLGRAADIYFVQNGKLIDPIHGWEFWHERWVDLGGKPMIDWDKHHFEG